MPPTHADNESTHWPGKSLAQEDFQKPICSGPGGWRWKNSRWECITATTVTTSTSVCVSVSLRADDKLFVISIFSILEETRIRSAEEESRRRQAEERRERAKNEIVLKALSEFSDLEALREEKRAIMEEEQRLKALLSLEKVKTHGKSDRLVIVV